MIDLSTFNQAKKKKRGARLTPGWNKVDDIMARSELTNAKTEESNT